MCTKRRYRTEAKARDALLRCRIKRNLFANDRRNESRVYYHNPCGMWHITSEEERMPGTKPNSGSSKDGRLTSNPGSRPGPKVGSKNGGPSKAKPENRRNK